MCPYIKANLALVANDPWPFTLPSVTIAVFIRIIAVPYLFTMALPSVYHEILEICVFKLSRLDNFSDMYEIRIHLQLYVNAHGNFNFERYWVRELKLNLQYREYLLICLACVTHLTQWQYCTNLPEFFSN